MDPQNPVVQPSEQPPIPTPSPAPRSSNLLIKVIICILAILFVSGLSYTGYQLLSTSHSPTPTPVAQIRPSPTPDPTANWKAIQFKDLIFKIPQEWWVKEDISTNSLYFHPSDLSNAIDINPAFSIKLENKTIDALKKSAKENLTDVQEGESIIPSGNTGYFIDGYSIPGVNNSEKVTIGLIKNDKDIYVFQEHNSKIEGIYTQILWTFKFTN